MRSRCSKQLDRVITVRFRPEGDAHSFATEWPLCGESGHWDKVPRLIRKSPHARNPDELDEGEKPVTPDREGLRQLIEGEVLPWFENSKKELANRPLIREQAFGESLDARKLEQLSRYEVHLDRKLERMLAMLLRLKDLRQRTIEE